MKSRLRREVEELEKRRHVGACETCRDVFYIGIPGLFVYLEIPRGDKGRPGTHRHGTLEEFEEFFWGCPECGEQIETKPLIMPGLQHKSRGDGREHGRMEVPDPWPISEWPPITQGKPRDKEYSEQINRLRGAV
jgi:hypothetical protein